MDKPIRGFLFDFDGTLAKTMEDHYLAWQKTLLPLGINLQTQEYYPLEGMNVYQIAQKVCQDHGLDPSLSIDLVRKKEEYYLQNNMFSLYPGVEQIVLHLKREGLKLGIVTAGLLNRIKKTVPENFLANFDAIITGDETKQGKPFPEPYLKGLKKLKLQPDQCIVVENAPLGIKAAKAAGIYCIAIASTLEKKDLNEADEVIETFQDLTASLQLNNLQPTPFSPPASKN